MIHDAKTGQGDFSKKGLMHKNASFKLHKSEGFTARTQ